MNEYLSLAHAGEKTQGREDGRGLVKVNFLIRRRDDCNSDSGGTVLAIM